MSLLKTVRALSVCVSIALCGCTAVGTRTTMLDAPDRPCTLENTPLNRYACFRAGDNPAPRPTPEAIAAVKIYHSREEMPAGAKELATVHLFENGMAPGSSEKQRMDALRLRAAQLGANGVVLLSGPPPTTVGNALLMVRAHLDTALIIVVPDSP